MSLPDIFDDEAEVADYQATLRGSYEQRVTVEVLTHERDLIATSNAVVLDGQVDCRRVELDPTWSDKKRDQEVEVSRLLRGLTIFDPYMRFATEASAPTDLALTLERSIRVNVAIRGALRWYSQPVFTGPISMAERTGPLVTVEAEGCEAFGLGAANTSGVKDLKGLKVDVFRKLMHRMGEVDAWMDVPTSDEKLPDPVNIVHETRYWDKAFSIMASLNRLCFYDAGGRLRTPEPSTAPVIDLDYGRYGLLLGDPQVTQSLNDFANAWREETSTKKGKEIYGSAELPDAYRLSAKRMGRNGAKRYILGTESNNSLRTTKKANKRAETMLAQAALAREYRTECRPVWHLSPFDWARAVTPYSADPFPVREFSLPLAGGEMTVGYREMVTNPDLWERRTIRGRS